MHDLVWYKIQEAETLLEEALNNTEKETEEYKELEEISIKLKTLVDKHNK